MKNPVIVIVLFCVALLTFSCAKEGPYLTEDGQIDPTSNIEKNGSSSDGKLLNALPVTISGFTPTSSFTDNLNAISVASRSFSSPNSPHAVFFSVGDFYSAKMPFNSFTNGAGMIQGVSSVTENFGLVNPNSQLTGNWGFEMAQSTPRNVFQLAQPLAGQYPDDDVIHLNAATNGDNGSSIVPLSTLLPGVSGWEIMDNKNGLAMLIVAIDDSYGFTVAASGQSNTNFVKSFVTANRVNAIRNYESS